MTASAKPACSRMTTQRPPASAWRTRMCVLRIPGQFVEEPSPSSGRSSPAPPCHCPQPVPSPWTGCASPGATSPAARIQGATHVWTEKKGILFLPESDGTVEVQRHAGADEPRMRNRTGERPSDEEGRTGDPRRIRKVDLGGFHGQSRIHRQGYLPCRPKRRPSRGFRVTDRSDSCRRDVSRSVRPDGKLSSSCQGEGSSPRRALNETAVRDRPSAGKLWLASIVPGALAANSPTMICPPVDRFFRSELPNPVRQGHDRCVPIALLPLPREFGQRHFPKTALHRRGPRSGLAWPLNFDGCYD